MKTEKEQTKEQAVKQFEANADKLEQFMKENMPHADYAIFIYDNKTSVSNIQVNDPGTETGLLNSITTALLSRIDQNDDKNQLLVGRLTYAALLSTLFYLAAKNPGLLKICKSLIRMAAPTLPGLKIEIDKEDKDNKTTLN